MRKSLFARILPFDDLRAFFASRSKTQLWAAFLSVALTIIIMTGFLIENRSGYMKPDPILVFAESWTAQRSAADVLAARKREAEATQWLRDADAVAARNAELATAQAKPVPESK